MAHIFRGRPGAATSAAIALFFVLSSLLAGCSQPAATPGPPPSGGWTHQLGSPEDDWAYSLLVDSEGNVVMAGTQGLSIGVPPSEKIGGFLARYDGQGKQLMSRLFQTPQVAAPNNAFVRRALVDGNGNYYLAGWTDDAPSLQRPSANVDAFLTKYDISGKELWTSEFGSSGQDWIFGMAVDGAGNVYVGGRTDGALSGQQLLGKRDAFIMKFDGSGKELWARQFGSPEEDWVLTLAADAAGNVYGAGGTLGQLLSGQASSGQEDAFFVKYDGQGKALWTRQLGSSENDRALSLVVDGAGNLYGAGWTGGVLPKQQTSGKRDAFLVKYDGQGKDVWTRQFGSSEDDEGQGVALDSAGNAYISGSAKAALPGRSASGLEDAFVAKFDGRGLELWASQFGSFMTDMASNVAVDGAGAVYAAGQTWGALPGERASGLVDAFLIKIE